MRLTTLCESMIKLPDTMAPDFMEFIYAYIIDFMEAKTLEHNSGHELLDHLNVHPSKPELHKHLKFIHTNETIMTAKVKLNGYKFKYHIDDKDKFLTIRLVDMGASIHGGYDDHNNTLTINVHRLKMLMGNTNVNEKFVDYVVREIENTLEHELMHYVQHKSFGKASPKQVQNYTPSDDSYEEYVKYATSPVEFMPMLKSEFKTFESRVDMLSDTIHINDNDRHQLYRYYMGDESARVDRLVDFIDDFKSPVLWGLRDQDKDLWKKAVKVMVEQYENHYRTDQ